jgi:hypothetical protein
VVNILSAVLFDLKYKLRQKFFKITFPFDTLKSFSKIFLRKGTRSTVGIDERANTRDSMGGNGYAGGYSESARPGWTLQPPGPGPVTGPMIMPGQPESRP